MIVLHSTPAPAMHLENDDERLARIPLAFVDLFKACKNLQGHREADAKPEVIKKSQEYIKELGRHLFTLGSHPCMQMGYYYIQACRAHAMFGDVRDPNAFHPSEINMLWDGIGVWRA